MTAQTKGVDVRLACAVDALSQNATYPADVALALRCIGEARAAFAELIEVAEKIKRDYFELFRKAGIVEADLSDHLETDTVLRGLGVTFADVVRLREALARVGGAQ
jgi:hypothetical protein